MNTRIQRALTSGLVLLIALFPACSKTQLVKSWKEPSFSASQIKKILVLGVGLEKSTQQQLEDSLVKSLSRHHVEATAAYTLAPEGARWDKEGLERLVAQKSYDTVIVSRLVNIESVEKEVTPQTQVVPSYHASAHAGYYGYYDSTYRMIDQPGYTITEKFAVVETRLYDVKTEKPVWSADSRTQVREGQNREALIRQFADQVASAIFKR